MTLIRKNSNLIGFEQGVSVTSFDKLFQQTRARFFPLAYPKLSFSKKDNTNASVILPIDKIPNDPGNGKYNLQIEDSSGQTLKIRVSKEIKATTSLTVSSASGWNNTMSFKLVDNLRTVTFTCDTSLTPDQNAGTKTGLNNYKFPEQGATHSPPALAQRIFNVINLAYESEELNIKPTYTQGESVVYLEQTTAGEVGNTSITLSNVSGKLVASNSNKFINGTLGIPRRENGNFLTKTGRRYHKLDSNAHALYTRGTESISQVAFDVNKIINNSGFKIKSKIIQNNIILIYQEEKGNDGLSYGDRTSPVTQAMQLGLNDKVEKYNFRFSNKELSGVDLGNDIFHDVNYLDSPARIENVNRYIDIDVGSVSYEIFSHVIDDRIDLLNAAGVNGEIERAIAQVATGWVRFGELPEIGAENRDTTVLSFVIDFKISKKLLEVSNISDIGFDQYPRTVKIFLKLVNPPDPSQSSPKFEIVRSTPPIDAMGVIQGDTEIQILVSRATQLADAGNLTDLKKALFERRLIYERISEAFGSFNRSFPFIKINLITEPRKSGSGLTDYILRVEEVEPMVRCDIRAMLGSGLETGPDRNLDGSPDNLARINVIRPLTGSVATRDGVQYEIRQHEYNSVKLDRDFINKPILHPNNRAKASLFVASTETPDWSPLAGFVLTGSNMSIDFTAKYQQGVLSAADHRIDENNYKFRVKPTDIRGFSNSYSEIAKDIIRAIDIASIENQELDIHVYREFDSIEFPIVPSGEISGLELQTFDYNVSSQLKIKVTKRLDVNATSFDANSAFKVSDGLVVIELFANPTSTSPAKISSTKYEFGSSSGSPTTNLIATRIYDALQLAVNNGDLDIVIVSPASNSHIDYYFLSRDNHSTNLEETQLIVSGTADENNLATARNPVPFEFSNFPNPEKRQHIFIDFREENDDLVYVKPNHDVEIRSFGLGDNVEQFSPFRDISFLSGSVTGSFSFIDVSPVEYISSYNGEFPFKLINFQAEPGFEYDGAIEVFPIREEILGITSDIKFKGFKGALLGSYDFNKTRNHSSNISSKINFGDKKQIPFYDVNNSLAKELGFNESGAEDIAESELIFSRIVYGINRPGIIFTDNRMIDPFIDTEERILQSLPLLGNNPGGKTDDLVNEIFNLNPVDDENLGGENFRNESGITYGTKDHPGTDSIVFGGLKYV